MKKKATNIIIESTVLLLAVVGFYIKYYPLSELFKDMQVINVCLLIVTVVLVNIFKMYRLYLALYGSKLTFKEHLRRYCKVTPVSIIIPYKIGELYRMYSFGIGIGNILKAIVVIILDRFIDTVALVTLLLFIWFYNGGTVPVILYFLVLLLALLMLSYFVFPSIYKFWRKFLINSKASAHRLWGLNCLYKVNSVYEEIESVVKGRGIVMYAISLIAWVVEIGNVIISSKMFGIKDFWKSVSDYLSGALIGSNVIELSRFGVVSIVVLFSVYIVIKIISVCMRGSNE